MRRVMRLVGLVSFVFLFTYGVALSGEVTGLVEFQPNTTARSSEVNQNFNTIKNAVNDNNSRIGTLEGEVSNHNSRIGALEGFKGNLSGSGCGTGQVMTGVSNDGTPQCTDLGSSSLRRTHSVTIHASACVPFRRVSAVGATHQVAVGYAGAYPIDDDGATNYQVFIECPIQLPEGAVIKEFHVLVYDNCDTAGCGDGSVDENVQVSLEHGSWGGDPSSGPSISPLADLTTSGSGATGWTKLSDTSLNHTVQPGPDDYYYFYVEFSHEDAGANLIFTSATIVYEY